jgi:hypothetical protein
MFSLFFYCSSCATVAIAVLQCHRHGIELQRQPTTPPTRAERSQVEQRDLVCSYMHGNVTVTPVFNRSAMSQGDEGSYFIAMKCILEASVPHLQELRFLSAATNLVAHILSWT